MFWKRDTERMRSLFLDQFEADGSDFLFRKNMKAPPIRVTTTERDAFAAEFVRRVRYIGLAFFVATAVLCVVPVLVAPNMTKGTQQTVIWIGIGILLTLTLGAGYWAWAAPARALVRRPVLGAARSKAEMRRRALAQITYGQLALCLPVAALLVLSKGIDSWWAFFAAGLLMAASVQAVRKWRFDRNRDR